MAVNNDPGNTNTGNTNTGNTDPLEQNPIRLTLGHYYCAKCGEDCLSRSEARCPRCHDNLRWDRVEI